MQPSVFHLDKSNFNQKEKLLLELGSLKASTFLFESGVCGLKISNEAGEIIMLPYQGQQVWSACFHGRDLRMQGACLMPQAGVPFLQTFGGFVQHCGVLGVGAPGPDDTHALHGELPNAAFQKAWLLTGRDDKGTYIGLSGSYRHSAFFGSNYIAEPLVKLYADSSLFDLSLTVSNLNNSAMELMYLAHINFRPVIDGRLVYSAKPTPENVRIRATIPGHIQAKPGYAELLKELTINPEKHHHLPADFAADPELVFFISYMAGKDGIAHSMQVHPDGSADYVAHRPAQLKCATRWISRTPEHNSLAIVEPGTCGPEGYSAEKKKGNILILEAGASFRCDMSIGALTKKEAAEIEQEVASILG